MSQLLSACEPQSFSKFNNKCQKIESILEANDLPSQKKGAIEKVVVLNARPPDTGRIFFLTLSLFKLKRNLFRRVFQSSFSV